MVARVRAGRRWAVPRCNAVRLRRDVFGTRGGRSVGTLAGAVGDMGEGCVEVGSNGSGK